MAFEIRSSTDILTDRQTDRQTHILYADHNNSLVYWGLAE